MFIFVVLFGNFILSQDIMQVYKRTVMKVLLTQDIKGLGKVGEIKEVKNGYGQNFIIAKGFGKLATNKVLKKYEAEQKAKAKKEQERLDGLKQLVKNLEKIQIKINKKAGNDGILFGAVTKEEISYELAKQRKITVDKKSIEFFAPIKHTGLFDVHAKFGHGIVGKFEIEVVAS